MSSPSPTNSPAFEFPWWSPSPSLTTPTTTSNKLSPPLIAMAAVIATAALILLYSRLLHRHLLHFLRHRRPSPHYPSSPSNDDDYYINDNNDFFISPAYYGLDDASIASLPLSLFLEPSRKCECAVCLVEFVHGDRLRSLPLCSHSFHVACIDVWLRNQSTCPLCRAGVFVPMRAARIRPSLDDIAIEMIPEAPCRDFLLKRSYSFGFERSADVSVSVSPWRYRHGGGGRGFWSKRWAPSPGSRVFSFRSSGPARGVKRRGLFMSMGTVGPSWRRSRAMTASPGVVRLPGVIGFGSSRMRCGDPEALLSPERFGRR